MIREVREMYPDGKPKVIVYHSTPEERDARRRRLVELAERAQRVRESLRRRNA